VKGILSAFPTKSLTEEQNRDLKKVCEHFGLVSFIHDWLTGEYDEETDLQEIRDLDANTRRAFREELLRIGNENIRLAKEITSTFPKSLIKSFNFNEQFNFDIYVMPTSI